MQIYISISKYFILLVVDIYLIKCIDKKSEITKQTLFSTNNVCTLRMFNKHCL